MLAEIEMRTVYIHNGLGCHTPNIAAPNPIGVADSDSLLIFPPSMSSSLGNLTSGSDFVVAFCTGRDVEDYCVGAFMTC